VITKQIVWRGRLVKMLDNCNIAFSREGDWCDFNFYPEQSSPEMPIALNIEGATVIDFEPFGDDLKIETIAGPCRLIGNPADGGCILSILGWSPIDAAR
jgi:hypothetical protein